MHGRGVVRAGRVSCVIQPCVAFLAPPFRLPGRADFSVLSSFPRSLLGGSAEISVQSA